MPRPCYVVREHSTVCTFCTHQLIVGTSGAFRKFIGETPGLTRGRGYKVCSNSIQWRTQHRRSAITCIQPDFSENQGSRVRGTCGVESDDAANLSMRSDSPIDGGDVPVSSLSSWNVDLGQLSPMMAHYVETKRKYSNFLLLYRVGDFFESFFEDAVQFSEICDLALTSKDGGKTLGARVPMAGIPHHTLDEKCRVLLSRAVNIAVVDQVEPASSAQPGALVRRAVTRLITPGTLLDESVLDAKRGNFICSLSYSVGNDGTFHSGLAFADVGTGELRATEIQGYDGLLECLNAFKPAEILLPASQFSNVNGARSVHDGYSTEVEAAIASIARQAEILAVTQRPWQDFCFEECARRVCHRMRVDSIDCLGCRGRQNVVSAAGALFLYVSSTVEADGQGEVPFSKLHLFFQKDHMQLDETARRNLEVVDTMRAGSTGKSLLWAVDRSVTTMGARRVRSWLLAPLMDVAAIEKRQYVVSLFSQDYACREELRGLMKGVGDLERLAGRAGGNRATPRELLRLGQSLLKMTRVADAIQAFAKSNARDDRFLPGLLMLRKYVVDMTNPRHTENGCMTNLANAILSALEEDVPSSFAVGCSEQSFFLNSKHEVYSKPFRIIREGFDPVLDALRLQQRDPAQALAEFETQEQSRTGLPSLRVRRMRHSGYTIRVPRSVAEKQLAKNPSAFAEFGYDRSLSTKSEIRFTSDALQKLERDDAVQAMAVLSREVELFRSLRAKAGSLTDVIRNAASALAELDVLLGFAQVSYERGYTPPVFLEEGSRSLRIVDGRHPVVEQTRFQEETFVPNSFALGIEDKAHEVASMTELGSDTSDDACDLYILCGPNASGKSCAMRLVGLIVILAQVGCHVPAASARLGVTDQIFTRVGAVDDLSLGKSTFQVEMAETAAIIAGATSRSLVLLDEIGRGTAIADGIAIAWSVAEHFAGMTCGLYSRAQYQSQVQIPRTIFVTHYPELNELAYLENVKSFHMQVIRRSDMNAKNIVCAEGWTNDEDVFCTHRIKAGPSWNSHGIMIAQRAGFPAHIVSRAKEIADVLKLPSQELAKHLRKSLLSDGIRTRDASCLPDTVVEQEIAAHVQADSESKGEFSYGYKEGFRMGREAALRDMMQTVRQMLNESE